MLQDFILRNGVMSLGGMAFPYAAKTANYTLTDEDYFIDCTSNTFTVTLPTAVGRPGQIYVIKNSGTGTITVATTSAQTIDGVSTKSLSQYNVLILASSGSGWAINSGTTVNAIIENLQTIDTNKTITASCNGTSLGPITINTAVTVTLGNAQRWIIL